MQLDNTLAGEGTKTQGLPPCIYCGHMPVEHPVWKRGQSTLIMFCEVYA